MRFELDITDVQAALSALEYGLGAELERDAQSIAELAGDGARENLERLLYESEPGRYVRTRKLYRGVQSGYRRLPDGVSLFVENTTRYAHKLEYGQDAGDGVAGEDVDDIPGFDPSEMEAPDFGHSGARDWWMPTPHIRPAAAWAEHTLARTITDNIERAIKGGQS